MEKNHRGFRAFCDEWYTKDDCGVEDKSLCAVRKAYEEGRIKTQAEAIRRCARKSIPKKNGEEILTETIHRSIIRECIRQIRDLDIEEIKRLIIERHDE